jgi:hypothetical protein
MSTTTALIFVNPIEPAPLSLRVPSGVETRLELSFFDQLGDAINTDLLAQLELTARSSGAVALYAVPTTDVVNGRARAILPPYSVTDGNGYILRLYGTVKQQLMLLATGVVDVTPAIGPTSAPVDVIDSIDLTFTRDQDAVLNIAIWVDATGTIEASIGTSTISAVVQDSQGGGILARFTVTPVDDNEVQLTLPAATVNTLPDVCWWSMAASSSAGMQTLAEGRVFVSGTIELPLPVTIDNWEYLKPATNDNPTIGQIVHPSIAQGTLKISTQSQPGTDQTALLTDLEAGDRITIGATTWAVRFTLYNPLGWFEVVIAPVAQDAVTGITPVKFEPPA